MRQLIRPAQVFWSASAQTRLLCVDAHVLKHACVAQVPVEDIMRIYRLEKAVVQGLQGSAAKYAWRLTIFCNRLGYNDMEVLLARFQVCSSIHNGQAYHPGLECAGSSKGSLMQVQ